MTSVLKRHFQQAASEIAEFGDNDTLPFDVDSTFLAHSFDQIASIAFSLFEKVEAFDRERDAVRFLNSLNVFSERLLVPTGSAGFRVTTKIHPFWNVYFNGLALCIAERSEPKRSPRAHSYRLGSSQPAFFDRSRSWRAYKEAALSDPALAIEGATIVQTDVSSFYENIYHHRLENLVNDLFEPGMRIGLQISRFLSKLASGRSFGLPVGGQCARVLAEVMMMPIDQSLSEVSVIWHRYVDDFTMICSSQQDAYAALAALSHTLADYGLSLNRNKTAMMSSKNYTEYVRAQLGSGDEASMALQEIDLYFDPYSDVRFDDYERLREAVSQIDITALLSLEADKTLPDNFIVSQISRSLQFQEAQTAADLCKTILDAQNLNAFRASWSTIMRGILAVRSTSQLVEIHAQVDLLLDRLPSCVPHLLLPEANLLHYLRTIRLSKSDDRGRFVRSTYDKTVSQTVKRACIDCWRNWGDRTNFMRLRNQWQVMGSEEQRMLFLALNRFGDEGDHSRNQLRPLLTQAWRLDFENEQEPTFAGQYRSWAEHAG